MLGGSTFYKNISNDYNYRFIEKKNRLPIIEIFFLVYMRIAFETALFGYLTDLHLTEYRISSENIFTFLEKNNNYVEYLLIIFKDYFSLSGMRSKNIKFYGYQNLDLISKPLEISLYS